MVIPYENWQESFAHIKGVEVIPIRHIRINSGNALPALAGIFFVAYTMLTLVDYR
ncbi:MAG: hypothetical protein DDT36_00917 [Firmicutes bacterium]|nr:hypothetical protein [Bacillota bacterium]MBT9157929.1 hypothetical protein [Bacillota bacterium]